ncbi:MAG TPA: indole-3-glycerol phosphate synthase TrpC [Anaerovoracaceae bacterium]|nr:indole-3-glycerol phosphate synthase TrpC [Anaerovoracaceae bacterium]
MTDILNFIAARTRIRVEEKKAIKPLEVIAEEAHRLCAAGARSLCAEKTVRPGGEEPGFPFERALSKEDMSFICEIKKASPSKGILAEDFPYLQIAGEYEEAGADAVSVLTEPEWFLGSDRYLSEIRKSVALPLLRKDFTVDAYQIYEAKLLGADAVLLICALLDQETLEDYIQTAHKLGLSALVEAHTEPEVRMAVTAGARIIGVNNRDLKTFELDINTSIRLRGLTPNDVLFISESGIKTPEDIARLRENKVDAVLIGETLMRSGDKKKLLAELRGAEV